jgi:hypothetical protein
MRAEHLFLADRCAEMRPVRGGRRLLVASTSVIVSKAKNPATAVEAAEADNKSASHARTIEMAGMLA